MKRLLLILTLFSSFYASGQAWQTVGSANPQVGVRSKYLLDADSGVLSKGIPVLTIQDTVGQKAYIDSLHRELSSSWLQVSGTGSKTITITRASGAAWLQATFNDQDNQTLSLSSDDSLRISGGNAIKLPYIRKLPDEPVFISTGTSAQTYTLPVFPDHSRHVQVFLNNALVYPQDYTISGSQITFLFPISNTDYLSIFYKNN